MSTEPQDVCAGLRYVHYRWELFSRDTTHQIFAAQYAGDFAVGYEAVQATANQRAPAPSVRNMDRFILYLSLPIIGSAATYSFNANAV